MGLGNQLFCYVTARCIAADRNAEFGVVGMEILNRCLTGNNPEPFLDLGEVREAKISDFERIYEEKEERIYTGVCIHDLEHGCYVAGTDSAVLNASDGTLLSGNLQAESYLEAHWKDIKKWLKVKPDYDDYEYTRDNLCILNIRGGEYTAEPELFLRRKYWLDAMAHMKKIRPDMEFMIVTEDVEAAGKLLPEIEAHHFGIDRDYVTVKNARYLILSNSSFACFPAFTSETAKKIIAPKYWARHNVSDGYWASEQNIYSCFTYLDRDGKLFSAEECRMELERYKSENAAYAKRHQKPAGQKRKFMMQQAAFIRKKYYAGRAVRSMKRRLKRFWKKKAAGMSNRHEWKE